MKNGLVLVFPGQGSQYVGMGKALYNEFKLARELFNEASDTLNTDLKQLCFQGRVMELNKLENLLPALLTISKICFEIYMHEVGIEPDYLIGHSLGEYSALTCSNAIPFTDALKLVKTRGQLAYKISQVYNTGMLITENICTNILFSECKKLSNSKKFVDIACYNYYDQHAVSGDNEILQLLENRLKENYRESRITPLLLGAPFHTKYMKFILDEYEIELSNININSAKWPIISNYHAEPYFKKNEIIYLLKKQLISPVLWQKSIENLMNKNLHIFIELGCQNILSRLISKYVNNKCFSYYSQQDRINLNRFVKKNFKENNYYNFFEYCLGIAVSTKNYNLNITNIEYNDNVVKPYRKIERYLHESQSGKDTPISKKKEAFKSLLLILKTKKISLQDQNKLINNLFVKTKTNSSLY